MPELPEVHTTATMLNRLIKGKCISNVWTDYTNPRYQNKTNIKSALFFKHFKKAILNKKITSVSRQGKHILIHLSLNQTIIIHMKMTGHLLFGSYEQDKFTWKAKANNALQEPINQFIHFVISFFDNTHLALSDVRKFAKVTLTTTDTLHTFPDLSSLGPDPTHKNFSFTDFKTALIQHPHNQIKKVLLDQTVLSGIGNIYSDEILFASNVHPQSIVSAIPENTLKKMFTVTKETLKKGVLLGGDSTSDYRNPLGKPGNFHYHHKAYRNTKKLCEKRGCHGTIQRISLNGRGTHFCPNHQIYYSP